MQLVNKSSGIPKKSHRKLINVPVNLKRQTERIPNLKWSTYFRARHYKMKKLSVFVLLTIFSTISFGQNITIEQIISFYKKKLPVVEETLAAKDWELTEAEEPSGFMMGSSTFAYEKSEYSNGATSFITFRYGDESVIETIYLQVNNTAKYNAYITRLKARGYKLEKSQVKDGSIQKIYRDKTMTFLIKSITSSKDGVSYTIYTFFLYRTLGNAIPNTFT